MRLTKTDEELEILPEGLEKVWSLRPGPLKIPLEHIVSATLGEPPFTWRQLKLPGTCLPGVIQAGSYLSKRPADESWVWEFWYVTRGKDVLTLELRDEQYRRVVLSLDDAQYWADALGDAGDVS